MVPNPNGNAIAGGVMLASATLALGLAALLASALPAWRAAGVEPMVALRNE